MRLAIPGQRIARSQAPTYAPRSACAVCGIETYGPEALHVAIKEGRNVFASPLDVSSGDTFNKFFEDREAIFGGTVMGLDRLRELSPSPHRFPLRQGGV